MCTNGVVEHFFEDIQRTMLPRGHHIRLQVLGTTFANLINLPFGMSIGWFILYTNKFHTDESPLEVPPLEHSEVYWIHASFYIGSLIGIILLTLCGDVFGRKNTIVVLLTPVAFGWCSKMLSTNATDTYIGTFLCGLAAGGSVNLIILFVAELADDKIRGRLGTILPLSINVGILIIFIGDFFLLYSEMAYITFSVLFVFLCTFTFFPDTPKQLYKIRRRHEAIKSLQLYSDIQDLECQTDNCYFVEVKKIRKNLISDRGIHLKENSNAILKSLIIGVLLIILNVYVNWHVVFSLTRYPLIDTVQMNVKEFRLIVAVCQVVGSVVCLTIVDLVERKYLLLASVAGITISQVVYGVLLLLSPNTTIAVISISLAAFSLHFGVYPLTFILIPEIVPEKSRIYCVTTLMSLWWLSMFGFSMSEWSLANFLQHSNGTFLGASISFNLICSFIFWFIVPQTKKKSYYEIFVDLNNEKNIM